MKKIVGLTGTTGSGKSTVAKLFCNNGFYVIDCDNVARNVVNNNITVLNALTERFGFDILNSDGTLNRKLLASKAFADNESTNALNQITLPAIINEVNDMISDCDYDLIMLDAPTLFESGADKLCCCTVCVVAPKEQRIKRIIARDNLTYDQALLRITAQHSDEFFEKNCTYIINNSGELNSLVNDVGMIAKLILNS